MYNGPARPFENPKLGTHTPMGPSSMMHGCKISTLVSSQFPSLRIRKGYMEPFFQSCYPLPSLFSSSSMAMISTTNLPLTHFPSPSHRPISLSSSLFPSLLLISAYLPRPTSLTSSFTENSQSMPLQPLSLSNPWLLQSLEENPRKVFAFLS